MISEIDMKVVEMQRMVRRNGYSLQVSRKGPSFTASVWNGVTQHVCCKATGHDNRLDAANDAWDQFKIIANELDIKLTA